MGEFAHLHVHSHYSLLDGLGKVNALCERAKELGMDSLALTDHGAMYGAVEFVQTAQKMGLRPIVGVEAYLAPQGHLQKRGRIDADPRHLTLLASNLAGYKNLMKLTTQAYIHGFYYKPRIDYQLLEQHAEGLIVLSGCLNGDIPQAILSGKEEEVHRLVRWHLNIFGAERFYFEVQHHANLKDQHKVNEALFALSREYKVGLVATADSHYIHPEDNEAQDVLVCVQTGKTVTDKDRLCMLEANLALHSPEEMKQVWAKQPTAIDNTQKIAEMCRLELEFGTNKLPKFPLPKKVTADQALRKLCEEGLKTRYPEEQPSEMKERLDYELGVIKKTGFASYFLIVADFVAEARRRGILVGPGRGSAAGSLVAYLTYITNIDPLKYDLLFERFLNPERVSMPDIDLDFADDRRDEVIEYVRDRYGHEHVAQIITFGTMAARASVRDAGRALGLPYAFCDQVAKAVPPMTKFADALEEAGELKKLYASDPQVKRLVDMARKLEGVCRHASTHAAGVVITEEPLTEHVPLQLTSTSEGEKDTVTQYAMHDVEALGLLKMDFLGLSNLTIIQNAVRRIEERQKIKLDIDDLPLDDTKTYQLLQSGATTGVFQLESSGMKRYLKELKPTVLEDIISMVALYRPGPMDSIPEFIAGKHGKRRITYLHPALKPILEKTYGVIVTQDQVLQIARQFSGFTYAEADILRKAVGKKIKELLDEQREKFINGAKTTTQVSQKLAQEVWDFIEPFARYGFNRAHAACYAMIAYQTAYLKANWPAEFMAALLTSDLGNMDRAAIEIAEALALGIRVLPPDVNESDHDFTVVRDKENKEAIRFGLAALKNVGHNVVTSIVEERKKNGVFRDVADFFQRVDGKIFNRKAAESLFQAGAFDAVEERGKLLHNLEKLLQFNRALREQKEAGQQGLFGVQTEELAEPRVELEEAVAAGKEQRLTWEKELLGMYVSEHPLQEFAEQLAQITVAVNDLNKRQGKVRVAGVVTQVKKITTKKGEMMAFVGLEDLGGKVEVLVFPKLFISSAPLWIAGARLVVEGTMSDKEGEMKILANSAQELSRELLDTLRPLKATSAEATAPVRFVIRLPAGMSREALEALQHTLRERHQENGVPVDFTLPIQGLRRRIITTFRLPSSTSAQELVALAGDEVMRQH
jgi:DNA polymerase-3 subunit alpha